MYACMQLSANHIIRCFTFFMSYHKVCHVFYHSFQQNGKVQFQSTSKAGSNFNIKIRLTRQFCMTVLYS